MDAIPFVDLAAQYRSIEQEVDAAIKKVLLGCNFILGPEVEEFEVAFARFIGVEHAIAVNSGLESLRLCFQALGFREGDEVIVPANSFVASALAVSAVGAKPVLVDCNPHTYNIDPALLEPAMTKRTRAIMPVHLTGLAADMDPILDLARRRGLHVIEDAAQAHGALYKGRACGSLGTAGTFSFYPSKNLGAYGDGGMITTNDPDLARKLRMLRNYGQRSKNLHQEKGVNARLDSLQAAVLAIKLKYLPRWNKARVKHARQYRRLLKSVGDVTFQRKEPFSTHIYHLFIIETDRRDELREYLTGKSIATNIHYPLPIHLQKAYAYLGYEVGAFPHTERAATRMISLPMYSELTEAQIQMVSDAIKSFFAMKRRIRSDGRPMITSPRMQPTIQHLAQAINSGSRRLKKKQKARRDSMRAG
jgi:dTDP-4-amino-4,6-dideoxygalactose transaminase